MEWQRWLIVVRSTSVHAISTMAIALPIISASSTRVYLQVDLVNVLRMLLVTSMMSTASLARITIKIQYQKKIFLAKVKKKKRIN